MGQFVHLFMLQWVLSQNLVKVYLAFPDPFQLFLAFIVNFLVGIRLPSKHLNHAKDVDSYVASYR